VVSFVHRFVLKNATGPVSFLELGCGSGPNLRFAPRISMDCTGIDASEVAVEVCNARLERDGLRADELHCPFGRLPFPDQSFDCVVDRASLMFADPATLDETVAEVHRVLKPGGHFFLNTIADGVAATLVATDTDDGSSDTDLYAKYPDFCLTSASGLATRFGAGWVSPEVKRVERTVYVPTLDVTAEWELVLQKV
jgi:SAM-dependent methyltransferase